MRPSLGASALSFSLAPARGSLTLKGLTSFLGLGRGRGSGCRGLAPLVKLRGLWSRSPPPLLARSGRLGLGRPIGGLLGIAG